MAAHQIPNGNFNGDSTVLFPQHSHQRQAQMRSSSKGLELLKTSKWNAQFPLGNSIWDFWSAFQEIIFFLDKISVRGDKSSFAIYISVKISRLFGQRINNRWDLNYRGSTNIRRNIVSACMFLKRFPILPYGNYGFQRQFLFLRCKLCKLCFPYTYSHAAFLTHFNENPSMQAAA